MKAAIDIRWLCSGVCIITPMLMGCVTRHYELEMEPVDGKLQRTLTLSAQTSTDDKKIPVDDEELARIASLYEVDVPEGDGPEHSFSRIFPDRTPNDLGGAGTFTHWVTSLGSTTGYLERIRGDDDIAAKLDRRKKAADRLVDLLIGWSETELAGATGLPNVLAFLDTQFRRDLINLGIYAETTEIVDLERSLQETSNLSREQGQFEILARMIQYCIERNYLTPRQIPEWDYAIDQATQQRPALLIELVHRTLASKIGVAVDQPIPAWLARLSNIDDLHTSMRNYLRETDEYRELIVKRKPPTAEPHEVEPPDPCEIISNLAATAVFPGGLFGGGDQLTAKLMTNTEPIATNGRWNSEARCVEWTVSIEGRRSEGARGPLPDLLYALWAEPAVKVQTELFGKVVVAENSLVSYCLWHQGLTEQKARRWDEFLQSLKPSPDLAERIRAFRFYDEPAESQTRSQKIRELLTDGLQ